MFRSSGDERAGVSTDGTRTAVVAKGALAAGAEGVDREAIAEGGDPVEPEARATAKLVRSVIVKPWSAMACPMAHPPRGRCR